MLRTLEILCILLKVLMLTRTAIVSTDMEGLEDLEDQEDLEDLEDSEGSGRYEEYYITHNQAIQWDITLTSYTNIYQQDITSFKIIDINDYISSSIESVQNYSDIITVRNEIALQEGTTPSPESFPSEPTFPRAFVEFGNRLNKKDIFVTFRWNGPEFTNGVIQKYRIQYRFIENLSQTIQSSVNIIPNKLLQYKVYDLKPNTMYYFRVQAHNEVGAGPYTKFINVSTTNENPVPLLLVTSNDNGLRIWDIDLQIEFELHKNGHYRTIVYSALEHKFFGIIEHNSELITWDFNTNAITTKPNFTKIVNLDNTALSLCIDWVARNLYWMQYYGTIRRLDLTLFEMGEVKYDNILENIEYLSGLNVLPSKGYMYWINFKDVNVKEFTLMQSDFDGKNVKPLLKNGDNECSCPYKTLNFRLHDIDMNIYEPLFYWTNSDKDLIATDTSNCNCKLILKTGKKAFFNVMSDWTNIYLYFYIESQIYILEKKHALHENKENVLKHVQKVHISLKLVKQIFFLDKSLQPYPSTRCLIPNMKDYHVEEKTITANSIAVSLPEPILNDGCEKYNLATTIYNISVNYLTCLDNDLKKSEEFNVQTYKRHYEFQNLMPFTEYTLKLALSNFYFDKLSIGLQFGADVKLTTTGKLNAPGDVTIQVLTPTLAAVYWMPPKKLNCVAVKYEVHWMQLLNSTQETTQKPIQHINPIDKPERTLDGKFFTIIQSLLPKQKYEIYVSVYPTVRSNFFTDSLPKIVYMSEPNNLILSGVSTNGMNISRIPSANLTIHTGLHYILEYKNDAMPEWQIANNVQENNDKVTYYIKNLLPRTSYNFRLILIYPEYMRDFKRSSNGDKFTFETLGDETKIPSAPGIPTVTRLSNFTHQLNWEPAQANDSQYLTLYRLEGLTVENNYKESNQTDKNEHWSLYYNGTDNYWVITRDMDRKYRFRVQAENVYGFGAWSEYSAVVDLTKSIEISAMQYYLPVILSLIVTLVIFSVYYFYCSYQRRKENNEQVLSPNIELALYEMPYEKVQFNVLYAHKSQYNPDKFALNIKKKQLTLVKLLGSGEFGKVFQGTVKNLEGSGTTPVAIKMLKNASSQDKKEFLQEAKIMSVLRHQNVLRLLGICLDADSPLLILELMEAGDLLTYLRESRTLQPSDSHALRLQDLLAMCEDVARGCCYLEKLHFVHRDLACRNCLISARNRESRIVKISDFGLARDIYEDDYYRVKGKGRFPIRWMAPESLVIFGKFTAQSDVWAFGVLMWEITSLGEHPYPAKNNSEVLQYVREGGQLPIPLNCPPTLYQLMQQCWSAVNDRPNFILCLENILTLRDNIEDTILSSVDIIRRAELPLSGQIEDVGSTASRTFQPLTANDASNDVIEPLT